MENLTSLETKLAAALTNRGFKGFTKKQLEFGELSDGSILDNYSITSQVVFGKPDIPIQLKDTGEFWRSFQVILEDDGFMIEADGEKTGDDGVQINLFSIYGEDVAGLNDKNMTIFINAFLIQLYNVLIQAITK